MQLTETMKTKPLGQRWQQLISEKGPRRIRQAAGELGVSELELLLCADADTGDATLLDIEPIELLKEFYTIGKVMVLTRNHGVVHEKTGEFGRVRGNNHAMIVINDAIDLRIFPKHWRHVVTVEKQHAGSTLRSFQFFDPTGQAVHKVYMRSEKGEDFWESKREELATAPDVQVEASQPEDDDVDISDVDTESFKSGWLAMDDTHEFFQLCKDHGLNRYQALLNAPEDHAIPVDLGRLEEVFEGARDQEIPIMVFVGNKGCIQIHTGPVNRLAWRGDWFNVLDPEFNLHVDTNALEELWLVRKPTEDGIVTSLEAYDANGEILMYLFGERKPGIAELPEWRELAETLVE